MDALHGVRSTEGHLKHEIEEAQCLCDKLPILRETLLKATSTLQRTDKQPATGSIERKAIKDKLGVVTDLSRVFSRKQAPAYAIVLPPHGESGAAATYMMMSAPDTPGPSPLRML